MDASETIDALGGTRAVVQLTGAKINTVSGWKRRGIPAAYWHVLVDAARERGIPGITFESLQKQERSRQEAA